MPDPRMRDDLELGNWRWLCRASVLSLLSLLNTISGAPASSPQGKTATPAGIVIELSAPEEDVVRIVKLVAEDPIVRGTYVYDQEQQVNGAACADSSAYFGQWKESGHAFFKVLTGALAPRHFKDSADLGTITVRYVVQRVDVTRTRLRVDAIFVEDGRRKAHVSDGAVEAAEFQQVQERLRQIQVSRQQAAQAEKQREEEHERDVKTALVLRQREEEAARLNAAESSVTTLEGRIRDLKHDVEVRIKYPGTELKSAPFQGATKILPLAVGTEVVVLIVTPYWYGVETADGHRGWLRHDQAEPVP